MSVIVSQCCNSTVIQGNEDDETYFRCMDCGKPCYVKKVSDEEVKKKKKGDCACHPKK